jgi:hypothetical protein
LKQALRTALDHAFIANEFFAIGTAVLPLDQEIAPDKIADPVMVLSVND